MNDQFGPVGVTTNGTHKVNGAEHPMPAHQGPESLSARSVDERLEALMETIRTWDWRAVSLQAGSPSADEKTLTASVIETTAAPEVHQDLEPVAFGPSPVETAAARSVMLEPTPSQVTDPPVPADPDTDIQSVVLEPMPGPVTDPPPTVDTQTVLVEPMPGPATVVPVAVPMGPEAASEDTGYLVEPGIRPRAKTRRGPIGRLWSHRWTKVAVCAWPPRSLSFSSFGASG